MRYCLNTISLLFVLLFTSCATAVYVPLEILRPSETTLPDSLRTLAIVINTTERTPIEDEGEIIDAYNERQRLQIKRENLILHFIKSISSSLKQASGRTLSVVSMQNDSVTEYILSNNKIQAIRDSLNADAVLSLDGLSVIPSIRLRQVDEALFFGDLDIAVRADLKLYMKDKYLPDVFSCKDTVSWQSYGETENRTLDRFPSFQNCLIDATSYSGYQASKKFYPYIDNVDRFYFVTPYPLMKEANSYWNRGNYEDASYLWEYIYENTEKMDRKAKAAANMALYEELNDQYDSALDWVKKSLDIFMESPEKYSNYIEYLLEYQQQLNVRIQENSQIAF